MLKTYVYIVIIIKQTSVTSLLSQKHRMLPVPQKLRMSFLINPFSLPR